MFEQALLDPRRQDRSPWAFAASTAGQTVALGAAILFSLIQTDTLPSTMFSPMPILAPRAARPAPPPDLPRVATAAPRPNRITDIFMPLIVPNKPAATILDPVDPSDALVSTFANTGSSTVRGTAFDIDGFLPGPPTPPVRRAEPAPQPKPAVQAAPAKPVVVTSSMQSAKLIHQVKPPYPDLAKVTRTSGTVRLEAIIGTDGAIRNLRLVSGHPLLSQAAIDAVKQWRYQPTLLGGAPVEVLTQIDVNFTLSQ